MSQQLLQPLSLSLTYELEISMTSASSYLGIDQTTSEMSNFNQPVSLNIWLGEAYCVKTYLLYKSEPIANFDNWKKYKHTFTLVEEYDYLIIEAKAENKGELATNGKVLIDYISIKEKK